MENTPINEELGLRRVEPGVFKVKERPYYVKIFSELHDREGEFCLCFVDTKEGIKEAEYAAKKYQDLVTIGFYPPCTRFIVARDDLNFVTIISVMPELEPGEGYPNFKKEALILKKKAAKVLGVHENELRGDLEADFNYGLLEGKLYFLDLHVLDFYKLLKHGKKYTDLETTLW